MCPTHCEGSSLLPLAALHGDIEKVRVLLSCHGKSETTFLQPLIQLDTFVDSQSGNTLLHFAAKGGQTDMLHELLTQYNHLYSSAAHSLTQRLSLANKNGQTVADCAKLSGILDKTISAL
uniref:Ankyrin repeat-containing protein YAR1 n=1 Tax=Lygus hesperus TaxID=30085 RepID=A0A0A9YIG8_LYGHE